VQLGHGTTTTRQVAWAASALTLIVVLIKFVSGAWQEANRAESRTSSVPTTLVREPAIVGKNEAHPSRRTPTPVGEGPPLDQ
jgi:hypothetical protein